MGIKAFIFRIVHQAVNEVIAKEVNTRIDRLETRINDVEKNLSQGLNDLEKRFEVRFDNIEKALATVQGNLEGETRFFHLVDYLKKQQSL